MEQVRVRIDRDNQRLDAGQVSNARELESLQSEVASLRRRQCDLEEGVLELMEKREAAQALRDGAAAEGETVAADTASVTARRDVALAEINEQAAKAQPARASVVGRTSPLTCSPSTTRSALSPAGSARRRCVAASAAAAGSSCPPST